MKLRTAGRSSLKKVRTAASERVTRVNRSAEEFADRLSLGGMQPAMAGGYGGGTGRVSARAEDTVQQMGSKKLESALEEKSKDISRSIKGKYNLDETRDLKGFSKQISNELRKQGLTLEQFNKLRLIPVDQLTEDQIKSMKAIRDAVHPIKEDTVLRKTMPTSDIAKYLSGEYTEIGGYVAKLEDVEQIKNYDDVVESFRLDYKLSDGSRPFPNGGDSYGVIHFSTESIDKIKIPYGERFGGATKDAPPCTLNGFTGSRNGTIIPEWKFQRYVSPTEGAKLYLVQNGESKLLAVFDGEKFVSISN
jgi:hypothetical protein